MTFLPFIGEKPELPSLFIYIHIEQAMSVLSAIPMPSFPAILPRIRQQITVVTVFTCVFVSYLLYHWLPGTKVYAALIISAVVAGMTFLYLNPSVLSRLIPQPQHNYMSAAELDVVSDLKAM